MKVHVLQLFGVAKPLQLVNGMEHQCVQGVGAWTQHWYQKRVLSQKLNKNVHGCDGTEDCFICVYSYVYLLLILTMYVYLL